MTLEGRGVKLHRRGGGGGFIGLRCDVNSKVFKFNPPCYWPIRFSMCLMNNEWNKMTLAFLDIKC